ncbi:MAG: CBS domain-containing protein [Anaerolineales bacterium]
MRLILTHEQADFDALASLFGASLLDEGSAPVLPRRLNRNLRSFLMLYGSDFPFIDPRDLPPEQVESVTLVDTQSLVTLKGMGARTSVRVIDHHPRREGLPADWQVSISEVGATTTLLVEAMQEQGLRLSPMQATLLLLGIYEDTGSLTYSRTTPRDVRASAWLLEQGVNLSVAADFLNPPLSLEQKRVFDQLVNGAQTHIVHGNRIIIACGDATEMDEEVSSLAHKLRDLLDPDALFVLVQTSDGVRMVARSTSDSVDVSAVAAEFGGGGHDRAAAALIRLDGQEQAGALKDACEKLLNALPHHVQPSVTVAQIMSRGPHLLSPDTPVKEVALLMQRTGFEGFPVVDKGKVIGLLKRRAVDRAIAHNLNLKAASLMDAGEVSISPQASLSALQTLMTDSGWGQIPVVEDGKVVGIVTRTDLLKTLAPAARTSGSNISQLLEQALPSQHLDLIRRVAEEAVRQNLAVYIVGGFVRDLLLERPSLDYDIVVEGDAIELGRALGKKYGGRVTSHKRFGTAKWFLRESDFGKKLSPDTRFPLPEFLDLISARTEFYEHPTALPTVARGSIKLDLHRRDFTINTLALRLDGRHYGELHDHWGGRADLERGLVRVLHSLSFVDDPTRMLRAVRYEQRYAFQIEARTLQLMSESKQLLSRLSPERVRHEIDLMLDEPKSFEMLSRLADLDLLRAIHPMLDAPAMPFPDSLEDFAASLPTGGLPPLKRTLGWLTWLLPISPDDVSSLARRLRFPASLAKLAQAACRLHAALFDMDFERPSQWVAALEDFPLLSVYAAYLGADNREQKTALRTYLAEWRHVQPRTTGHDLRKMGLPPGPEYQRILVQLRDAWLDGKINSKREEARLLKEIMTA